MKKSDVELILDTLKDVKTIVNRLDYNTSSALNKRIMTIYPLIEKEYDRLDTEKIEINSPKVMLIGLKDANEAQMSLTDFTNNTLEDLVSKNYKIIDFGPVVSDNSIVMYIKYTD